MSDNTSDWGTLDPSLQTPATGPGTLNLLGGWGGTGSSGGNGGLGTWASGGGTLGGQIPAVTTVPSMSTPSLQQTMADVFTGPLNQFDPGWQQRAQQSGMTAEGITGLVSSFATSGDSSKIFGQGVVNTEAAGSLISDMLAGKISQADQAGLSQRSAENAQALGAWGGAVGGAARGLEARDLGMTQYSLQQAGLRLAGQTGAALASATQNLSGISSLGNQASKDALSMQLAQGGIGVAQDWMGMSMQMQAGNLNAAAKFNSGKMLAGGGPGAAAPANPPKTLGGDSLMDKFNKAFGGGTQAGDGGYTILPGGPGYYPGASYETYDGGGDSNRSSSDADKTYDGDGDSNLSSSDADIYG